MTDRYQPQVDVRRHFLVTGTYTAEQFVNVRELTDALEKTLRNNFADPQQIMAYNTPKFHHPYAVDLREQYIKLSKDELAALTAHFPHLMTSLITFLQGAFVPEEVTPVRGDVVVEIDRAIDIVTEVKRERP